MRFCAWSITDNTETDKRYSKQMAYLGNGCTFHIDSQTVRIVALNLIQFSTGSNETVAGANQAGNNSDTGMNLQSLVYEFFVTWKKCG